MLLLAPLGVVPRTPTSLHEPDQLKYPVLPLGEGRVFFAGLQKAGTTSFAAMMDHLGLRTVHGTGYGFYRNNQSCLDDLDGTVGPSAANGWKPDYERVLYELGPNRVRDMLVLGKVQAASDKAWPLLFPFIAKLFPKAKFVLWPRPAAKWVRSFTSFFGSPAPSRHTLLSYGAPSYGALNASQDMHDRLALVWEAHVNAVKEYFRHTPSRLLLLDFEAPDAGRKLCRFALGDLEPRCLEFTTVPSEDASWIGFKIVKNVSDTSPHFQDAAFESACWTCPHRMTARGEAQVVSEGESVDGCL